MSMLRRSARHCRRRQGADIWIRPGHGRVTSATSRTVGTQCSHHATNRLVTWIGVLARSHPPPAWPPARSVPSVRPSLQAWVKGRAEVLAPSTVATVVQVVVSIFRAAVADRVIPSSPTIGLKLPQQTGGEVRPLTSEQVAALAGAVADRYRALVIAGAGTGLRAGELPRPNGGPSGLPEAHCPCRSPTHHPGRPSALPRPAENDLEPRALSLCRGSCSTRPAAHRSLLPRTLRSEFTQPNGQPVHRSHLGHVWRRAIKSVGPVGAHFHDLRHFAASALIASGASVKSVQHFLGHTSAKVDPGHLRAPLARR